MKNLIRSSFHNAQLWQTKDTPFPTEPDFRVFSEAEYTRRELYELVWNLPMSTFAQDIKVSTTTIKQACTKHHIPVPGRGYWSKIAAGKSTERTALPTRPPGMSETMVIGGRKHPRLCPHDFAPTPPTYPITIEVLRTDIFQKLVKSHNGRSKKPKLPGKRTENRKHRILEALIFLVREFDGIPEFHSLSTSEVTIKFHQQRVRFKFLHSLGTSGKNTQPPCSSDTESLSLILSNSACNSNGVAAWHDTDDRKLGGQLTQVL